MIKYTVEYFQFPIEDDLISPIGHWEAVASFNSKKEAEEFAITLDWSEVRIVEESQE